MLQGLDVEAECGRNGVDRLPVEPLQDRRFASIVESPGGQGQEES